MLSVLPKRFAKYLGRKAAAHLLAFAFLRRNVDDQARTALLEDVIEELIQVTRQLLMKPTELIIPLGVANELGKTPPRPTTIVLIPDVQLRSIASRASITASIASE